MRRRVSNRLNRKLNTYGDQLKTDNRRMIIFEGAYIWTLQRQADRWMIAGLQAQPIRKKT